MEKPSVYLKSDYSIIKYNMLDILSQDELEYFLLLYKQLSADKTKIMIKFRLWGANKYKYNKYKLPKFLEKCDIIELEIKNYIKSQK